MTAKIAIANLVLLLFSAHRLPAPIIEEPSSPPPASKAAGTKSEKSHQDKSLERTSFAGTWHGMVKPIDNSFRVVDGKFIPKQLPDTEYTLTINFSGTRVHENSTRWGSKTYSANLDGRTIKWVAGGHWTLTPSSDGQTAVVHYPYGIFQPGNTNVHVGEAIFRKIAP